MTIKEARHLSRLSQIEMAKALEIPRRTIEEWETNRRKPPVYVEKLVIEKLLQIAEANNDLCEIIDNSEEV
jgi:DNA-binding transcriptional regulator YiaG